MSRLQQLYVFGLLLGCSSVVIHSGNGAALPGPTIPPTFTKDVAPIIFQNCSTCHRPGESAPFKLLDYQDVKKHMKEIAEVTARRYMPPWLPEAGYGAFVGARC